MGPTQAEADQVVGCYTITEGMTLAKDGKQTARKGAAMTPAELRKHVRRLSPGGPVSRSLERARAGEAHEAWYRTQKEHLLGWLGDYNGPGYYGRANWRRSAEFAYNHLQCAAALLWLGEAAGAPRFALLKAKRALLRAGPNFAAESAAVRSVLPWGLVEALLKARQETPA